jgi:hypothetical protein
MRLRSFGLMLVGMCFASGTRLQFDAAADAFSGPLVSAFLC